MSDTAKPSARSSSLTAAASRKRRYGSRFSFGRSASASAAEFQREHVAGPGLLGDRLQQRVLGVLEEGVQQEAPVEQHRLVVEPGGADGGPQCVGVVEVAGAEDRTLLGAEILGSIGRRADRGRAPIESRDRNPARAKPRLSRPSPQPRSITVRGSPSAPDHVSEERRRLGEPVVGPEAYPVDQRSRLRRERGLPGDLLLRSRAQAKPGLGIRQLGPYMVSTMASALWGMRPVVPGELDLPGALPLLDPERGRAGDAPGELEDARLVEEQLKDVDAFRAGEVVEDVEADDTALDPETALEQGQSDLGHFGADFGRISMPGDVTSVEVEVMPDEVVVPNGAREASRT